MKKADITKRRKIFDRIARDIKEIKIQGARNIAKKALYAYSLVPNNNSKKILLSLRPTEPMLWNVLKKIEKTPYKNVIEHFDASQKKINESVLRLITKNSVIFTHCHSNNVVSSLIYARKKGKKFEVYNTETRPLFQGRTTSKELEKGGIKVTMFVDSAVNVALSGKQGNKKVDKIFLGADAITKQGVINKIGSGMISEIAKSKKIPFYIIADSWKFTEKKVPIEKRKLNEVWDKAPKKIKIKNPAFEFIPKKNITAIVSELGILNYGSFIQKAKRNHYF